MTVTAALSDASIQQCVTVPQLVIKIMNEVTAAAAVKASYLLTILATSTTHLVMDCNPPS